MALKKAIYPRERLTAYYYHKKLVYYFSSRMLEFYINPRRSEEEVLNILGLNR